MAKCEICGKKMGFIEGENFKTGAPFGMNKEVTACAECAALLNLIKKDDTDALLKIEKIAAENNAREDVLEFIEVWSVDTTFKKNLNAEEQKKVEAELKVKAEIEAKKDAELNKVISKMLVTSGTSFDGYRVVRYIDFISTEVFYRNSFGSRLSAELSAIGFSAKELEEYNELVENGRAIAYERFKKKAAIAGGNAILGVDQETTIGAEIVKIGFNGTVVEIEKIN